MKRKKRSYALNSERRLALLTSGGDAPGMNACLRAVVRTAAFYGWEVLGIRNGYDGLIQGLSLTLSSRSVGNLIQRGGTFLGSSRSSSFRTKEGRKKAYDFLKAWNVSGLIVLGGDGSLTGAHMFAREYPIHVIGIPVTIDNDLLGTDVALGFDSAVNTAVRCIDNIRDTADSHGRIFVIEVMGRNTGHLALETALAVGAEFVVIPEKSVDKRKLISKIQIGIERGKAGSIVIVAERNRPGWALELSKSIQKYVKRDVRTLVLGHLQRGGAPTSTDRNIGAQFGSKAVELVIKGKSGLMVGIHYGHAQAVPFSKVFGRRRPVNLEMLKLVDQLSI